MSNEAADQPTILDILSEYIDYDDLEPGKFDELLDRLRDRDNIMQSDAHERGLIQAYKNVRSDILDHMVKLS
jgi:hypothetical protein